jgi:putative Mn2+ efflux pump MntP
MKLMDIVAVLLVAVGLAMDAFAVSVAHGIAAKNRNGSDAWKMAVSFGSFQALMPVMGWSAGLGLSGLISGFDHWVAFGLLGFIGGKMIVESMRFGTEKREPNQLTLRLLLVLSVATSIDALAVGLSFAFLQMSIAAPIAVIGAVTFLLSFLGVSFGSRLGHLFENRIEIVGGLILVGIGLKILFEHLV